MSILNTVSKVSNKISLGSSALSLIGMGTSLFKKKSLLKGIEGFVFDIKKTETITNSAQITDHYAEDNTYLQDHIALNPVTVTLVGTIGELVFTKEEGIELLKGMVNRLTPLGILSPTQAAQGTKLLASAEVARSAYGSLEKSWNSLKDVVSGVSRTKQGDAYATLEGLFEERALITVETPWKTFEDMVIESFTTDQEEDNTMETVFSVTCKQMRFVGVKNIAGSLIESRYDAATSTISNKGVQTGKTADSAAVLSKTNGAN